MCSSVLWYAEFELRWHWHCLLTYGLTLQDMTLKMPL